MAKIEKDTIIGVDVDEFLKHINAFEEAQQ